MGVWCGAFYGLGQTETDFYELQLVRRCGVNKGLKRGLRQKLPQPPLIEELRSGDLQGESTSIVFEGVTLVVIHK